jgi:hypothetical protein
MQENDNCNSLKDASSSSLLSIPPQSKKEKMVVKKSQPGVKASIRKNKRCCSMGCANQAQKGGVCITHGAKMKQCSFEGCTNGVIKGAICVTHGAMVKHCSFVGWCQGGEESIVASWGAPSKPEER